MGRITAACCALPKLTQACLNFVFPNSISGEVAGPHVHVVFDRPLTGDHLEEAS